MATNYRHLKWGNDTPTEVIWKVGTTSYWPGIIKWGNDVVWARALDVNKDTTTGISSIDVTLDSSIVPFSVVRGTNYYYGDVLKCDATYAPYWTGAASGTKALSECFNLSTSSTPSTFYVRSLFQPSRTGTRTITITADNHVSVSASYTKVTGSTETITTKSTTASSGTAWQGSSVAITATADKYYTVSSSSNIGNHGAGTSNITASATSAEKKRAINGTITGALTLTATYHSTASSTATSKSITASGQFTNSSFSGSDVTWSATPAQWWTMSTATSGTVAAADNTTAVSLVATAVRLTRTLSVKGDAHVKVTFAYTNSGGSAASIATKSATVSGTSDAFQGAQATSSVAYDTYYKKASESNIGTFASGSTSIAAVATSQEKKRAVNVTYNTGVGSITVKYQPHSGSTTTVTPTASGSVTDSSFSGAPVTWTATASSSHWTVVDSGTIGAADNESTVTVQPTATRNTRGVHIVGDTHVVVAASYTDTRSGDPASASTRASSVAVPYVWTGAAVTTTATCDTYYKLATSACIGTYAAGTSLIDALATSTKKVRTGTVTINSGVASITVKYTTTGGSVITATYSSSGSIPESFSGAPISYNVVAQDYWSYGTATETIAAANNESAVSVSPQPTRVGRTIGVKGDSHVTVAASYKKTDVAGTTGTISTKSTTAATATAWAGDTITASATYDTYYKKSSESNMTISPGTTTVTATASSTYKSRAITVSLHEGTAQEIVTYWEAPTSIWPTTQNVTSSGFITGDSYSGKSIGVTSVANRYWVAPDAYAIPAADNETTVIVSSTPTRKMRKIIVSNPDSRVRMALTYVDANGDTQTASMDTFTQTSYTSPDTWCGSAVIYRRIGGTSPTDDVWFNNGALSGTIDPENTTSSYTLDMGLKTFDLRTYSTGVITYYTSSSMTTAVTQSQYSGTLYYKFTANDGFYIENGSTYTTTVSGTVPTSSTYVSGDTWGPFTTDPALYSKIDLHILHRGNVYYRQSGTTTWSRAAANTPGTTHSYVYFKKGVYYQVYASYVASAGSTSGLSTNTYGSATDTYTSSSSYRSVYTTSNAATFTFSGTLTARSVTINQVRAAHKTGVVMQYRDLNYDLLTKSNPTINILSASVWRGASVTLTATGTFTPSTGWTHNYNTTFGPGTYALSANLVATYNYSTHTSTSGSGPSLAYTFSTSAMTNPSIAVVASHGSNERTVTLTRDSTYGASGTPASAQLTVTANRSASMVTVNALITGSPFVNTNEMDIYVCQNTIAPPAMRWDSGKTTVYVYNPNNLAFKFTGTARYVNSQVVTFATSVVLASCASASYGLSMTGSAATGSVTSEFTTSWYSSNSTLP